MSSLDFCLSPPSNPHWLVSCLCAQWCGTCRDYRTVLATVAGEMPAHAFAWIDIEDEAELVGDLDIETFPTILVQQGEAVLFCGPVLPGPDALRRLLRALAESGVQTPQVGAEIRQLAVRLAGLAVNRL